MIIVATQMVIFAIWLASHDASEFATFGLWSLYGQWAVLLSCFLLCAFRRSIAKQSYWVGALSVACICLASLGCVELVSSLWSTGFSSWHFDTERFIRLAIVTLVILVGMLRFFSFLVTLEGRNNAESQARIEALQSRIQPHFLFNSLNTISELAVTQPEHAEKAINSLSMLFRANLENNRKFHSLKSELNLCRRYVDLETWRIGDRLHIQWDCNVSNTDKMNVPKLILQPIIENAIMHGAQADGVVDIVVDVRESNKYISMMVENIKGDESSSRSGHGIALDNIKERLFVLFDDQQNFKVKDSAEKYTVIMRFPKTTSQTLGGN